LPVGSGGKRINIARGGGARNLNILTSAGELTGWRDVHRSKTEAFH